MKEYECVIRLAREDIISALELDMPNLSADLQKVKEKILILHDDIFYEIAKELERDIIEDTHFWRRLKDVAENVLDERTKILKGE